MFRVTVLLLLTARCCYYCSLPLLSVLLSWVPPQLLSCFALLLLRCTTAAAAVAAMCCFHACIYFLCTVAFGLSLFGSPAHAPCTRAPTHSRTRTHAHAHTHPHLRSRTPAPAPLRSPLPESDLRMASLNSASSTVHPQWADLYAKLCEEEAAHTAMDNWGGGYQWGKCTL